MKVIEISKFGAAEGLKAGNRSQPRPQDGEVLIKVHAAGLNRPDILQRLGHYPPPPGASDIPGLEIAGDIVKSHSNQWQEGDKVCALLTGGGYAEYAVAPAGQCLPVPDTLNMIQAAALPEALFTVWNTLFKCGQLKQNQTALVHGGASGIGTMAIQMAKAIGAKIIVTAGSDKKCESCRALGAALAINYKTQDFAKEIGEDNIDVVLDMIGGDYLPRNLEVLKPEGKHVSIAFLNGAKAEINIPMVMQKRLVLTGSTLRPRPAEEKEELRDEILEQIWPHIINGTIKPVIFKTFALDQATEAHLALEKGDHIGKIILKTKGDA